MLHSDARPVVLWTEMRVKHLLLNGLLSFSAKLFLDAVHEVEYAGDEIGLVGFGVLADNFETVFQLLWDVKLCIARGAAFLRFAGVFE